MVAENTCLWTFRGFRQRISFAHPTKSSMADSSTLIFLAFESFWGLRENVCACMASRSCQFLMRFVARGGGGLRLGGRFGVFFFVFFEESDNKPALSGGRSNAGRFWRRQNLTRNSKARQHLQNTPIGQRRQPRQKKKLSCLGHENYANLVRIAAHRTD